MMGPFTSVKHFKSQDYFQLRKQQLSRGVKFVDDEFPVEKINIPSVNSPVEYKRPTELVDWPCLRSEDDYFNLKKGFVENFNVLLAFSCLKVSKKLWSKVFVSLAAQEYDKSHPNEHPGIFRFRFWQEGWIMDVVIDDRLPCKNDKLICTRSSSEKEFWPALLEKAYAKLLGGYEYLEHLRLEEILMDLTGGLTECIDLSALRSAPPMKHVEFYERLEETLKEGTLVIFCTEPGSDSRAAPPVGFHGSEEQSSSSFGHPGPMDGQINPATGLCIRYGYLLTRTCAVPKDTSLFGAFKDVFRRAGDCPIRTRLLRLRCPLTVSGGGAGYGEWIGPYSSSSTEWEELGLEVRRRLHLGFDSESEFWIPLDDLMASMAGAVVCRLPDTSLVSLTGRTWELNEHHGAWHGHLTGGSLRFRDTFLDNPQYYFDIKTDSEEVLLGLIRKHDRDPATLAIEPNPSPPAIGLGLFMVERNRTTRLHKIAFAQTIYVEAAKPYRTILISRTLCMGRYVVIPFLEEPLATASFLLRLFLPKGTISRELSLHFPLGNGARDFFFGKFKQALRVCIHSAVNLDLPDGKNHPSPYCMLSGEDKPVTTSIRHSTCNPMWRESFIFYRRRPQKVPIVIQIFNKRTLGYDEFLGRHSVKESEIADPSQQELVLYGKDTDATRHMRVKGSLIVEFYFVDAENFLQI